MAGLTFLAARLPFAGPLCLCYGCFAESSAGERMMDTWESFFSQKSRRRSRRRSFETAVKRAILFILFASIAAAIFMTAKGLPR